MVAPGPLTWNATITAVNGDERTADIRTKWVNYHDGGGLWLPIQSRFSEASNGGFEHTESPWSIEAPPTATGRIKLYGDNDYDPHIRDYRTLTSVPTLELDHPDASPVDAIFDPANPWEINYPDALGDGCDLRLRTWHAKAMRAVHLIAIRKMPTGGNNAVITERIYTPLRIHGWTGDAVDIGASGAALVVSGDPTLGIRMRPAVAWYRVPETDELVTTPIEVIVERRVGAGYVMLTKIIPSAFIASALAVGAVVYADETTSTFYPDANTETNTVDGYVGRNVAQESFAAIIAGAANVASDSVTSVAAPNITAGSTSNLYTNLRRNIYLFDTSPLTAAANISSATLSISGTMVISWIKPAEMVVVSSNPASNTAVATGDYGSFGSTDYSSRVGYAAWNASGYTALSLNAAGISAIAKTGITKLGIRLGCDVDATQPTTWLSTVGTSYTAYMADQSGTSNDPKLAVTWTSGPPKSVFACGGNRIIGGGLR